MSNRTAFITGGSRGIGLAIARRLVREGINVAIAAKTAEPHPTLPGTIYSAASEIESLGGGKVLPLVVDVRSESAIATAIRQTVETFGGIDICVNNASAVSPTRLQDTPAKRFDLMQNINVRGTFLVSQAAMPHLLRSKNPHVLTLAPPFDISSHWFAEHAAYTLSKFSMALCSFGLAAEFRGKVGFNTLWPMSTIDTSAVRLVLGGEGIANASRSPEIMADAAWAIINRPAAMCSGESFIDELVLQEEGISDFTKYSVSPETPLCPDMFVPPHLLSKSNSVFGDSMIP